MPSIIAGARRIGGMWASYHEDCSPRRSNKQIEKFLNRMDRASPQREYRREYDMAGDRIFRVDVTTEDQFVRGVVGYSPPHDLDGNYGTPSSVVAKYIFQEEPPLNEIKSLARAISRFSNILIGLDGGDEVYYLAGSLPKDRVSQALSSMDIHVNPEYPVQLKVL